MNYRREIDGLIALAVIAVILFHAGIPYFGGGFVGVDVFFVISGYLITSLIVPGLQTGSFSFADFYERRARRILPALFLVMSVCLPFAWLWLLPLDMKNFAQSLIAVSLFVSNLMFGQELGYFDIAGELKPLLHTWSLAIEEQFYLLFPLMLVCAYRLGRRFSLAVLLGLFVASLLTAQWGSMSQPNTAFYQLSARGWELLLGTFVSFYMRTLAKERQSGFVNEAGAVLGLLLVASAVFGFNQLTPFPGFYALVPTLGAALIIVFANSETATGRLLGSKVLVAIGLLSYSAYLWHQPVLAFARHIARVEPGILLLASLVVLSFALAWLTWKFVETPMRDKRCFSRGQIIRMVLAGTALFAIVGFAGLNSDGFASRISYIPVHDGDVGQDEFVQYLAANSFSCTPDTLAANAPDWRGFVRCRQSKANVDVDIAIVGDSHAEHLFIGIADSLKQNNVAYYIRASLALPGDPVFADILTYLQQAKSVHAVLLALSWSSKIGWVSRNSTAENELAGTIKALLKAGKSVYLVDDVPRFSFSPQRCKFVTQGLGMRGESYCDIPKQQVLQSEASYLPLLRKISSGIPALHYHELRDLLCDDNQCSMVKNNVLMYRDSEHLNIPGSLYIGAELVKLFPELGRNSE